ncbi:MAG: hypothetical protein NTY15_21210 [Planctomycetota bacterium]|nr:hypothetical protein [Planctomycetota bacterium]
MKNPIRTFAGHLPILLGFVFCWSETGVAQDIFSGGGLDVDNSAIPAPKTDAAIQGYRPDPDERSAVVLSFRSNPPKTAKELARAIQLMARIRRWDEVGHWLDEAVKLGLNESNAAQMVQTAGTQTFLQLMGLESNLSDLRRANAKKILDLSTAAANNPTKLKESVFNLQSNNKTERILAYKYLESAGSRGVAALINHMLAENSAAPSATMSEAFTLLGKPAFEAWLAAMGTQDKAARGRLALLAAPSGEPTLSTQLCVVALDPKTDESVREDLNKVAANRKKSIPSSQSVYRHAMDQMQQALAAYQKVRWMDEPDAFAVWKLSADGRTVSERPARLADLDWTRTVQFASAALQCGDFADSSSGLAVAILAENACRSSPDLAGALTLSNVAMNLPTTLADSYEFGCLVWDSAQSSNLSSAQLVAVQNLTRWAAPITTPNAVRERLSTACKSGFGAVRYAAAQGLLSTMYRSIESGVPAFEDVPFDGRNRLERVLAEMRNLDGGPLALILGGATDLRSHVRAMLESFGYRVLETSSATQTMSLLRECQPIEAVFVVSPVLEMKLGDLAQRIRANPATASCPIAILAASLSRGEHEILDEDPRVVMGNVPPEQAGMADILRRMAIVTQSPPMDSANRNTWRDVSLAYWRDRQNKFVSTQPKASTMNTADTPVAQLELIRLAIDRSKPLLKREQASQNFVQSLQQFGVLMSSETVKAQYDEYNKRGPDDLELRNRLGRILDAIEAAQGDRPWTEVAP